MKIAIATDDYQSITGHVGRCNGFLVYDVQNGEIISEEKRDNNFTNHGRGQVHAHRHGEGHGKRGHKRLAEGLNDCSHLICHGAGWRLVEALKAENIELVLTPESDASIAALKFEKGELEINNDLVCDSH